MESCGRPAWARGWCGRHYQAWRAHGDAEYVRPPTPETCSIPDCLGTFFAKLLCEKHYKEDYYSRNKEALSEQMAGYRRSNSDKIRERRKRDYDQNRERYLASALMWSRENPDLRRAIVRRYGAKRWSWVKASEVVITQRALDRLMMHADHRCTYCRVSLAEGYHWDHVIPLSRGGTHSEGNLVPTCPPCNLRKNKMTVMEWRMRSVRSKA